MIVWDSTIFKKSDLSSAIFLAYSYLQERLSVSGILIEKDTEFPNDYHIISIQNYAYQLETVVMEDYSKNILGLKSQNF